MKTVHTFRIVEEEGCNATQRTIYPQIDMTIESEADITDMLYAFERFLQGAGYTLPQNSYLDFVTDETIDEDDVKYKEEF